MKPPSQPAFPSAIFSPIPFLVFIHLPIIVTITTPPLPRQSSFTIPIHNATNRRILA
jgi:hypothetical protein